MGYSLFLTHPSSTPFTADLTIDRTKNICITQRQKQKHDNGQRQGPGLGRGWVEADKGGENEDIYNNKNKEKKTYTELTWFRVCTVLNK